MGFAEISIPNLSQKDADHLSNEISSLVSDFVLVALPNREMIDGYMLGGVDTLTAFRFEYDPGKDEELINKFVFKTKLKHKDVMLKILFYSEDFTS